MTADRGSTVPLLLGFVVVALLVTAGAVAVGEAFVQQQGLQATCDGAAAAAAAAAVDLSRGSGLGAEASARLAGAEQAVQAYLDRDARPGNVQAAVRLPADARRVDVECRQTSAVVFGAAFGRLAGIRHTAHSSARAALSP